MLPEAFVSLYPSQRVGARPRPASAAVDELWERMWAESVDVPGPLVDALVAVLRAARRALRDRRQRARGRAARARSTTRCSLLGPDGLLHRHRKLMPTMQERLFHGVGAGDDLDVVDDAGRARRRADLLGEPHAAGALGRLPGRPADLGRADRRRHRRLARVDAPHRDRVRGVRRLGAAVHPARPRSRTTSRCRCPRARGVRQRRRGDRRADVGRGDRRAAVRRGGDRRRRLRPAPRPARQALVRRRRPLRPRRRARRARRGDVAEPIV